VRSLPDLTRPTAPDALPQRNSASALRGIHVGPYGFDSAKMRATSNQDLGTGLTKVVFDVADYDTPGSEGSDHADAKMVDLTNERLTFRRPGVWVISYGVKFQFINATGRDIVIQVQLTDATVIHETAIHNVVDATFGTTISATFDRAFDIGDEIELYATVFGAASQAERVSLAASGFPYLSARWHGLQD
jgi:hypothetical protein